jgi:hypothetical protein
MGVLPVHSHAFWTKECTNNILKSSHTCIQRIHPPVFRGISGSLDSLQFVERPCRGIEVDVGTMQVLLDIIKYQEVHLWDTFWDTIGPYSVQTRLASRSCKYCSDCQFTTIEISTSVESNIGTHKILQELHKRV